MKYYIACLIGGAIAGAAAIVTFSPKFVTKTEVKEQIRYQVVTRERVVTAPDGTKIEERIITDETKINRDKIAVTAPKAPDWLVSGGVGTDLELNTFYVVQVQRRIFSGIFVGVSGASNGTVIGTIGIQF